MPERVAVEIKNETPRAWLYRRIRPGFPRPEWISKSRASFTPDEAMSTTRSGLRIKAGWLTFAEQETT